MYKTKRRSFEIQLPIEKNCCYVSNRTSSKCPLIGLDNLEKIFDNLTYVDLKIVNSPIKQLHMK